MRCHWIVWGTLAILNVGGRSPAFAGAETCGAFYWQGSAHGQEVDSVDRESLEPFLRTLPAAEGIGFAVKNTSKEVWVDITTYPGEVTLLAATRVVFILGRMVKPGYDYLVLADNGEPVFKIGYDDIHRIGCQFVWGEEGGQNPIALIRDFVDSLRYYSNGARVAPEFPGSLFGDTNIAVSTMNEIVNPQWVLRSVKVE